MKAAIEKIFELIERGELDNAYSKAFESINSGIKHPGIFTALGIILCEKGHHQEAINYFLQVINQDPLNADVFNLLGVCYLRRDDFETAIVFFEKTLKIDPNHSDALANKAMALFRLSDFEGALSFFDKAIGVDSNFFEAFSSRGSVYKVMGLNEKALEDYDRSIEVNPNYATAYFNKGNLYKDIKDHVNAIKNYDQALILSPDYDDATWNKANTLLRIGRYIEGWKLYEIRWKIKFLKDSYRKYSQPMWTGKEVIKNKIIFVFSEQGLGDVIQFSRYLSMLTDLGAEVIFETPLALKALFQTLKGNIKLLSQGEALPKFDFYSPLMSLPLAFDTRIENIPSFDKYLSADKVKVEKWAKVLEPINGIRVGLVWSGGIRPFMEETTKVTQNKSIPLDKFSKLRDVDVSFISLQKGAQAEDELKNLIKQRWNGPKVFDYSDELKDFSDTAALIENLDLVISVCTSVAHLSAAMGKRTWILIPYHACWRWLDDASELSPWYPSVRLFRQSKAYEWENVIHEVCQELKKFTNIT